MSRANKKSVLNLVNERDQYLQKTISKKNYLPFNHKGSNKEAKYINTSASPKLDNIDIEENFIRTNDLV